MTAVELPGQALSARDEGGAAVRLAVHDASRLEWSLSVPLPRKGPLTYALRVELRIPSNSFVRHAPWEQMQSFTRLDGAAMQLSGDALSIDQLRRGALGMAAKLSRASEGFSRHCRLAGSLFAKAPHDDLKEVLEIWLQAALRLTHETREAVNTVADADEAEVRRERELVDEYISVRLLEMLASAQRSLSALAESRSRHAARVASVAEEMEEVVASALSAELTYRKVRGFPCADPDSAHALEHYLDRSSKLKKHFQEVLFLERESYQVADRAYHWVAGFFALVASTWAFMWQIALVGRASNAQTVSSGVVTFALLAGVVYASKDRLKEIGRNWMTRRVHRVWGAQRVTKYRAPARRLPGRDVIVTARESFEQGSTKIEDTLNPSSGAVTDATVLSYTQKGSVVPHAALRESGVRRVKHVFRYDLSPLFARLDDAVKQVPVLDDGTHKVRFIDAPRCYRVAVKVEVEVDGGEVQEHFGTLVMHKQGLERIERDAPSDPNLADGGVEPT
jgi:hypothetical protein